MREETRQAMIGASYAQGLLIYQYAILGWDDLWPFPDRPAWLRKQFEPPTPPDLSLLASCGLLTAKVGT